MKTETPAPARALRGSLRGSLRAGCAATAALALSLPARAHVKWFAPYIVEAPPQRIAETLADRWFWTGILLVLAFFLAARWIEKTRAGGAVLAGMDKLSGPLWLRLDDFMRFVITAFFVAIFAVGGVYLTPDLRTPNEWVSWMQLAIAALVFSRRTMPFAAAGIILLWVLALTEYQLFHLLDYLALGVAVAAYLVLESSSRPHWRKYRFEVLRWGVAIALMWSSLEKFAYPDWFYPLVEEKPFLTFGMPRDVFIPMAGVAEFTMGFGLLWTALIRRLSAFTLFFIFNAAVYPFGRMDLVGHALIMAVIVAIFADPTPQVRFAIRRPLWTIPASLVAALLVFSGSYWGLHAVLYGPAGQTPASASASAPQPSTHAPDPQRPHGGGSVAPAAADPHAGHAAAAGSGHRGAYAASMARMHKDMEPGAAEPDPDVAFVKGMIPHHQGAIEMARIQLQYGKDPENRKLAGHIIGEQEGEVAAMKEWLRRRGG
ncbi:MAG: DUF305 domain-containing protein [Pseudomonadota bacterium]